MNGKEINGYCFLILSSINAQLLIIYLIFTYIFVYVFFLLFIIIIIIIIIIIKWGRQLGREMVICILSVQWPQPHNTNL